MLAPACVSQFPRDVARKIDIPKPLTLLGNRASTPTLAAEPKQLPYDFCLVFDGPIIAAL
jgi:hypothetical protein